MAQSVATGRIGPFRLHGVCAILAQCLGTAFLRATAPLFGGLPADLLSCPVPGRASADRSNVTFEVLAALSMIGPHACRSRIPKSTSSKHGSATCSTNCSDRAD